jgi:hypothetical protein
MEGTTMAEKTANVQKMVVLMQALILSPCWPFRLRSSREDTHSLHHAKGGRK